MPWVCPDCQRTFVRTRQGHECAPAMTLDEYFSTGPERERPIFEAVIAHLGSLGPVIVEPVSVGIFLKKPGQVAQLRPANRWVDLCLSVPRQLRDARIVRKPEGHGGLWWHRIRLTGPDDVDDLVRGWLTEAYEAADDGSATA